MNEIEIQDGGQKNESNASAFKKVLFRVCVNVRMPHNRDSALLCHITGYSVTKNESNVAAFKNVLLRVSVRV